MTTPDAGGLADDWQLAAEVETCATCRYWHRDEATYTYGMCRRWPPRAGLTIHAAKRSHYDAIEVTMQTSCNPEWPNTGKDDGCGEHKERKPDPPTTPARTGEE